MSKRSRYEHVIVANGNIQLHAGSSSYYFKAITQWQAFESVSNYNPEEVRYCLTLIGPGYDMVVVCASEIECDNIIDELTEKGIGKRM
jgi:hypothetical protein|uniref:Uncharacterized protein n=1 Tax=viral metagenome TaxID=1070528 RepID=A0A6C0F4V5_9ZZZZ